MRALRVFAAAAIVAGACAGIVSGAAASGRASLLAAGARTHGWIVLEGRVFAGDGAGARLYHVPGAAASGTVLQAQSLPVGPVRVAAWGERVYMVYEPVDLTAAHGVRSVRTIAIGAEQPPGWFTYTPPDRQEALAALPAEGTLAGLVGTRAGPVALLLDAKGGRAQLLHMGGEGWGDVPLPPGFDESSGWRITALGDGFALAEFPGRGPARLWTMPVAWLASRTAAPVAGTDEGPPAPAGPPEWTSRLSALTADDAFIAPGWVGDWLVAGKWADGGALTLDLVRGEERFLLARLSDIPKGHTLFTVGERAFVAWFDAGDEQLLDLAVVSTVTGRVLHRGPAIPASPLRSRDLQVLALLLGAVVLTVVIFLLRPEAASRPAIQMPPDTALAEPAPRALAGAIDLFPCFLLAARVTGAPIAVVLGAPFGGGGLGEVNAGLWPFVGGLAIFFVHSALGEWLTGRTIGKAIVGCRTVSTDGGPISLWQSVSRNAVKAMAPPVAALVLMDPRRRHPGDVVAGTVVVSRLKATERDDAGSSPE